AYKAGDPPTIVQVYEVGTQTMLDSGIIVPVYTLNKGEVDWSEVVDPIRKYYSVDGNLYCMPFNSSTAMLYYNKDMFEAAGLDPDNPPKTWSEVEEYSKKIMEAGVAEGGFSMGWPAWIFEQMFAYHGQLYANNDNGRSGLATEVLFNSDFGVMVLTEWQRMAQEGVLVYGGREYKANDPFLAGQFPFLFQSTSSLAGILKKAEFKVGTTFLPRFEGDYPKGNSVVGGGCLWVIDKATPEQREAAWEFLKYSFSPERAVIWHKGTGYFPTSNTAYKMLQEEGWFDEEPNHATAFNQILGGVDSPAARGVLLGNFVQIRDITGTAIEEIVVNGADPKETLDKAAADANQVLADYAQLYGK
ncbi:MAG: ABC transporter substrate-binding protein, partial [Caldilineae bacterium]